MTESDFGVLILSKKIAGGSLLAESALADDECQQRVFVWRRAIDLEVSIM